MAQIIIATHGGLSRGMLDSLHMVAGGAADGIETYSLEFGQNPNDYYEQLRERIKLAPSHIRLPALDRATSFTRKVPTP